MWRKVFLNNHKIQERDAQSCQQTVNKINTLRCALFRKNIVILSVIEMNIPPFDVPFNIVVKAHRTMKAPFDKILNDL